jgi:phosphoadenosine phosphosulfate reductase
LGVSPSQSLRAARELGVQSVLVAFSGGKDALACLDLAVKVFPKVQPYFLYWVKGLSFQERTLRWAEQRYGLEIMRLPHAFLSAYYIRSDFRHDLPIDKLTKKMGLTEQENVIRAQTGITWLIAGKKRADSLWRRGELAEAEKNQGIDRKRRTIFPLLDWTDADVWNYLKLARVPTPADYRVFAGLAPHSLSWDLNQKRQGKYLMRIRETWPEDYQKIRAQFPLVDALVKREEIYGPAEEAERQARRAQAIAKAKATRAAKQGG